MPEKRDLADVRTDGIELELPELDLMSIDSLDGTVLGQILLEIFSDADPETGSKHSHHHSHSSHSSFSSFSSHSSSTWSGRA
ncbi:hypothetical protein ACFRMN_14555 [Streptomyces sp. NPDC056835]|uniref:hypothetical protein n=1 Tax=Streptomyces sp. NPDC056835 TaxID=3345956 RepID=UPI00369A4464